MPRPPLIAVLRGFGLCVAVMLTAACHDSTSTEEAGTVATTAEPRGLESPVPVPELSGPVDAGIRGRPWMRALEEVSPLAPDYIAEEYFFSGTASGWTTEGSPDGTTAAYTSRMLVQRPKRQEDFNGTVLVEWFNVTAEMEIDVIWAQAHAEVLREGYAYVGISVQQVGVSTSPLALKYWDPVRYAPLQHPGDAYAYDILAQGTRALFADGADSPLGELQIERVIASGESQSAALLIPYINHVDPIHHLFDGYLVHTYPGVIDAEVEVPVLMLLSEAEIDGITSPVGMASQSPDAFGDIFGSVPGAGVLALPPPEAALADFPRFRVWEIAGAAHYDQQGIDYAGGQLSRDLSAPIDYVSQFDFPPVCTRDINQLGMERPMRAALRALNEWLVTGQAPPVMPRIQRNVDGSIARDADGLAIGGIRMPVMEVPVGVNEGTSCTFFGSYTPFGDDAILARYPNRQDFLDLFIEAAQGAVDRGVLLPPEAEDYIREAEAVSAWEQ